VRTIDELLDLSGQVAVVTGAAVGIGQGIAYRLAEAGATVVVADIDYCAAQSTARELASHGWATRAAKADVASETEMAALFNDVDARYGRLDILVNNAGIYPAAPITEMAPEDFDRVLQVNLRGVFLGTKYAAQLMRRTGGGRIINVTSIDAVHPGIVGLAHYDASKHAAWGFTKSSALELAQYNIRVNAIAPGPVATPGLSSGNLPAARIAEFVSKIPLQRMGEPDEIGTVALFLASEMASYLTGCQIVADGGRLLS
jgi:2-deoxy-D-gluconate 3-dehydrogenase